MSGVLSFYKREFMGSPMLHKFLQVKTSGKVIFLCAFGYSECLLPPGERKEKLSCTNTCDGAGLLRQALVTHDAFCGWCYGH